MLLALPGGRKEIAIVVVARVGAPGPRVKCVDVFGCWVVRGRWHAGQQVDLSGPEVEVDYVEGSMRGPRAHGASRGGGIQGSTGTLQRHAEQAEYVGAYCPPRTCEALKIQFRVVLRSDQLELPVPGLLGYLDELT